MVLAVCKSESVNADVPRTAKKEQIRIHHWCAVCLSPVTIYVLFISNALHVVNVPFNTNRYESLSHLSVLLDLVWIVVF